MSLRHIPIPVFKARFYEPPRFPTYELATSIQERLVQDLLKWKEDHSRRIAERNKQIKSEMEAQTARGRLADPTIAAAKVDAESASTVEDLSHSAPPPTLISFTPTPTYTFGRRQTEPLSADELARLQAPLPVIERARSIAGTRQVGIRDTHFSFQPEVVHAKRGGLATYHGPGQIVFWPVIDLRSPLHKHFTIVEYMRLLEDTTIATLRTMYGIESFTTDDPGVWARKPDWKETLESERKAQPCGVLFSVAEAERKAKEEGDPAKKRADEAMERRLRAVEAMEKQALEREREEAGIKETREERTQRRRLERQEREQAKKLEALRPKKLPRTKREKMALKKKIREETAMLKIEKAKRYSQAKKIEVGEEEEVWMEKAELKKENKTEEGRERKAREKKMEDKATMKVAAMGVHFRRHVTSLGIAVNYRMITEGDESKNPWARIVACGLPGRGVTTVAELMPNKTGRFYRDLSIEMWADEFARRIGVKNAAMHENCQSWKELQQVGPILNKIGINW
ncbi:hypothetical protein F4804DRAFT_209336 [Jackrogersella minutella]|nr:hypothetical protein F4804DRAFT_209336 [Jackrogersella minutella]